MRIWYALLAVGLAACRHTPPSSPAHDASRLRSSFAQHQSAYLASLAAENALVSATLQWLNTSAATQPRSQLRSTACQFTERWARVYFVPRHIHQLLRFDRYTPGPVEDAHTRLLERLRVRYFLLHEYQRYGQRACEASVQSYNVPGLPPGLAEFRARLQAHPQAIDELTPLLDALPR
ncbi:MAG: hypothetical protein IPP47_06385 [Bryobacterales bacterium]|nr:hypothetical protein [Bryobacterales bacterium]